MSLFALLWLYFQKINWHILSGFFPLVFGISLAMDKTNVKNAWLNSLFFHNWSVILFFFNLCHLPAKCYLGFVFKTKSCSFSSEFLTDLLCLEVTCWCLCNTFEFFQSQTWLCVFYHWKHWNQSTPKTNTHKLILS